MIGRRLIEVPDGVERHIAVAEIVQKLGSEVAPIDRERMNGSEFAGNTPGGSAGPISIADVARAFVATVAPNSIRRRRSSSHAMTKMDAAGAMAAVQLACVREISDCTVIRMSMGREKASSIATRLSVTRWSVRPRIAATAIQSTMKNSTGPYTKN
jgi:hypothetical protein